MATLTVETKPKINPDIRREAQIHIEEMVADDPAVLRVYLFPSENEMRMLYVEENVPAIRPGDEIAPFYSKASPHPGARYPRVGTVILPEEAEKLPPPYGWADWSEAEIIWEANPDNAA